MELTGSMIVNFFIIFVVIPAVIVSFFHLRKINRELDLRLKNKTPKTNTESHNASAISRKDKNGQNFAGANSFRHGVNSARRVSRFKVSSVYGIKKRETVSYSHHS